jgi:adenine phosphoribosyltransferase
MCEANGFDPKEFIRSVPDFPKAGILFRDITPLLASPEAFRSSVGQIADRFRRRNVDAIAAVEARGFLFAAPLALELDVALVPIRKPGKLPCQTIALTYALEYGTDALEIHADAFSPGAAVLVVDDLLATGGTVEACCRLVEKAGAKVVACAFLIELATLGGAKRIAQHEVFSLIKFD